VDAITSSDKGQRVRAGKSIWPQWPLLLYYWVSLYTRRPSPADFPTPPAGSTFGHSGRWVNSLEEEGECPYRDNGTGAHDLSSWSKSSNCLPSLHMFILWLDLGFHTAASIRQAYGVYYALAAEPHHPLQVTVHPRACLERIAARRTAFDHV